MRAGGFLSLIALLAVVGPWLAWSAPDGLERVAQVLGFAERATEHPALLDYGPLTGLAGAALVGGLAYGLGRLVAAPR